MKGRTILRYEGEVKEDGAVMLPRTVREDIMTFKGKRIVMEVREFFEPRSPQQNRYYWGVIVIWVLRCLRDAGNMLQEDNREDVKEVEGIIRDHCGIKEEYVTADGEVMYRTMRLSKYDKIQQEELSERARQWALKIFGVRIPLPNEQLDAFYM